MKQSSRRPGREYSPLAASVRAGADRDETMRSVVDAVWEALSPTGVSWVGLYLPGAGELVLGPCRDTPACSPIGLHGVCGRSFRQRRSVIVRDVRSLGEDYVACDPRDLSEVVVPMLNEDGTCRGVLDLDSFEVGTFTRDDALGLEAVLRAAGLTRAEPAAPPLLL